MIKFSILPLHMDDKSWIYFTLGGIWMDVFVSPDKADLKIKTRF